MTVKIHTGKPLINTGRMGEPNTQPDRKENKVAGETTPAVDKVKISSFAREAARLDRSEPANDAARAEKVARLKQQVADGSYDPDPEKVAKSLLKYIFEDR
ncbi:FlgM family anti-sigma-28 factor [Geothermobacter ehrlichii]|uniref:Negative regulator of flagellin synthesis n=1 Tax=Geothermobacter ehrlichii TaxID=213224 RepID=A0A5D3WNN7_9BACT|nr:flagellar biosynthesis anti-sigma factor FlgM [Geothermobacter ehrlichii]TYP00182.1 FlgM family anti-sigma-28 factor [Geothermobacter ehrlichii]